MGTSERICAKAQAVLMPDEQAVAARVGTNPNLNTAGIGGAVGGLAAHAVRSATLPKGPTSGMAARLSASSDQTLVLVVTTHRLVVFEKGLGTNLKRPILGAGPTDLRRVEVVSGAFKTPCVNLDFADGSAATIKLAQGRGLEPLRHALATLAPHAAAAA